MLLSRNFIIVSCLWHYLLSDISGWSSADISKNTFCLLFAKVVTW